VSGQREATEAARERLRELRRLVPKTTYNPVQEASIAVGALAFLVDGFTRVLDLCDEWAYEGNTMITRSHAFCSGPPKASARTVEAASWS
jgi:hypothetical protein